MSPLTIDSMKRRLCQVFDVAHLEIIDESHKHVGHAGAKGGGHYRLTLVSKDFEGKKSLERQRMIMNVFKDDIPHHIHAISIKALSLKEFQSKLG